MIYNGKPVYTSDTFSFEKVKIGDYVNQEVVDDCMGVVPPVCMSSRCSQTGEPYSYRQYPNTGKWRSTYSTFKCVAGTYPDGIWEYCGHCFRGETEDRGKN